MHQYTTLGKCSLFSRHYPLSRFNGEISKYLSRGALDLICVCRVEFDCDKCGIINAA